MTGTSSSGKTLVTMTCSAGSAGTSASTDSHSNCTFAGTAISTTPEPKSSGSLPSGSRSEIHYPTIHHAPSTIYISKKKRKLVRFLTVVAYMFAVSLVAIVLSLYYIFLWNPYLHGSADLNETYPLLSPLPLHHKAPAPSGYLEMPSESSPSLPNSASNENSGLEEFSSPALSTSLDLSYQSQHSSIEMSVDVDGGDLVREREREGNFNEDDVKPEVIITPESGSVSSSSSFPSLASPSSASSLSSSLSSIEIFSSPKNWNTVNQSKTESDVIVQRPKKERLRHSSSSFLSSTSSTSLSSSQLSEMAVSSPSSSASSSPVSASLASASIIPTSSVSSSAFSPLSSSSSSSSGWTIDENVQDSNLMNDLILTTNSTNISLR